MESLGIQTKELSQKTGISENTLKTYLKGNSAEPTISKAVKIAKALNTSLDLLTTETSPENSRKNFEIEKLTINYLSLSEMDRKSVQALIREMISHY